MTSSIVSDGDIPGSLFRRLVLAHKQRNCHIILSLLAVLFGRKMCLNIWATIIQGRSEILIYCSHEKVIISKWFSDYLSLLILGYSFAGISFRAAGAIFIKSHVLKIGPHTSQETHWTQHIGSHRAFRLLVRFPFVFLNNNCDWLK